VAVGISGISVGFLSRLREICMAVEIFTACGMVYIPACSHSSCSARNLPNRRHLGFLTKLVSLDFVHYCFLFNTFMSHCEPLPGERPLNLRMSNLPNRQLQHISLDGEQHIGKPLCSELIRLYPGGEAKSQSSG